MTGTFCDIDGREDTSPDRSRDTFEQALVAAGQMAYRYDPEHDQLVLGGAIEALTGCSASAIGSRLVDLLAILHPEDRRRVTDRPQVEDAVNVGASMQDASPPSVRCLHPDGTVVLCELRGELFPALGDGDTHRIRHGVFSRVERVQTGIEWRLQQNPRQLAHVLEVGKLGAWSMDARTRRSSRSRRIDEIFGLAGALDEWNYRVFLACVHPDDRERVDRLFSRTLETGRELDVEARIVRLEDGERRWISARGSLIDAPDGVESVIISVVQDITERKLADQRDRFLADVSVPLNSLVDRRGTLEQIARMAVPFLGDHCSIDLVDGSGEPARIAATSSMLVQEAIAGRGATNGPPSGVQGTLAAGESVMLADLEPAMLDEIARSRAERQALRALDVGNYLGVPLTLRGRHIGVMHFYRAAGHARYSAAEHDAATELGSRVAVALENARLYDALLDSSHRNEELLAMLSHELRNPLESMSIGVELLASGTAPADQHDWARSMIHDQVNRLRTILDDLLDASSYTLEKVVLDRHETDLAALVSDTVEQARAMADARGYALTFVGTQSPIRSNIDAPRVSQAIHNLLANALKYGADRGGIRVALAYERTPSGGVARISIADDGVGMKAAQLDGAFEPFAQFGTTIDRSSGGLGMGLTLARRIARVHGGSIVAASAGPDRGSTFTLSLPASGEQRRNPGSSPGIADEAAHVEDRRLMLVDDNPETVTALQKLFLMKGYDVQTAEDGLSAIALARTFRPHMAVLDIGLPGANGYEVARALRDSYAGRPLLLIALSGYGQQKDRDRAAQAGFDHHLLKPVNFRMIIDLLRSG